MFRVLSVTAGVEWCGRAEASEEGVCLYCISLLDLVKIFFFVLLILFSFLGVCRVSPGGIVLLVGPSGVATRSGWTYSQGFYFPPRVGG